MATPTNDSHSCASGGSIFAGRAGSSPVVINGNLWTPNRDAGGVVLASDWQNLPLNQYVSAVGGVMNDVIETPHYPSDFGPDGSGSITRAWCGASCDYVGKAMHFFGGGHGDSSACENGVYKLDVSKLQFSRIRNRTPLASLQQWDINTGALGDFDYHHGAIYPPQKDGAPGARHTYSGMLFIPATVLGNASGGVLSSGNSRSVLDLDTGTWRTPHWNNPLHDFQDWSNMTAFLEGNKVYHSLGYWFHHRYDLSQTEATDWSPTSFGKLDYGFVTSDKQMNAGSSSIWCWLPERREEMCITGGAIRNRIRYGQALDEGFATNWSNYFDAITLTSSDGSHADFSAAKMIQGDLSNSGCEYDHTTGAIYIQPNQSGTQLYKITGIATNTWNVQKIGGSNSLSLSENGAYGKFRILTLGGKKVIVRVTLTTGYVEVMRIS